MQTRDAMARLARVEWQIAVAAAPFCPQRAAGTGLKFDSADAYAPADRPAVARLTGLADDPQVLAVAPGSPAAAAGLRPGDLIVRIDGRPVQNVIDGQTGAATADRLEAVLAVREPGTPIRLGIARGSQRVEIAFAPVARCRFLAVYDPARAVRAYSDRSGVALTRGLMELAADDDQIAMALGHELAHLALRDRHAAQDIDGKRKEDEADRLGFILARCAGYDADRALAFWARFDGRGPFAGLPSLTHRSGKAREERLRADVGAFDCATGFWTPPAG